MKHLLSSIQSIVSYLAREHDKKEYIMLCTIHNLEIVHFFITNKEIRNTYSSLEYKLGIHSESQRSNKQERP